MSNYVRPKMQRAALLAYAGGTTTQIAHQLDVRPETVSRWKRRPEFIEEFELLKSRAQSDVTTLMHEALTQAFKDLAEKRMDLTAREQYDGAIKLIKALKADQFCVKYLSGVFSISPHIRPPGEAEYGGYA